MRNYGVLNEKTATANRSFFLIDPNGVVKHVHEGFKERASGGEQKKLRPALDKLLK